MRYAVLLFLERRALDLALWTNKITMVTARAAYYLILLDTGSNRTKRIAGGRVLTKLTNHTRASVAS